MAASGVADRGLGREGHQAKQGVKARREAGVAGAARKAGLASEPSGVNRWLVYRGESAIYVGALTYRPAKAAWIASPRAEEPATFPAADESDAAIAVALAEAVKALARAARRHEKAAAGAVPAAAQHEDEGGSVDPTANVREQRELASAIMLRADQGKPQEPQDAERLAELVQDLDGWMKKGGFAPAQWGTRPLLARGDAAILAENLAELAKGTDIARIGELAELFGRLAGLEAR